MSRHEAPLSYVPLPLLPLPLQAMLCILRTVTIVTTHDKKPQDSFWWTWGQFFGSDAGLCPLARTIPLPTHVIAFLLHAMSLSHGCTEADACSKSSWASANFLSGSCCSLHVAGLRQELVSVEIRLKPLALSWLLPSGVLLASGWFRRQGFPYKSAVLRNKDTRVG